MSSDLDAATWLQDAPDLVDRGCLLSHEAQDTVRDHDIDALGLDGQRRGFPFAHLDVSQPASRGAASRALPHRLRHVDADGPPADADVKRGKQKIGPSAGSDVDHSGVCGQRPHAVRIPHSGERFGDRSRQPRQFSGIVVRPRRGVLRAAMEMKRPRRIRGDACVDGFDLGAKLEGIEIDGARDRHTHSPR
jgi:hypothetical protein